MEVIILIIVEHLVNNTNCCYVQVLDTHKIHNFNLTGIKININVTSQMQFWQ